MRHLVFVAWVAAMVMLTAAGDAVARTVRGTVYVDLDGDGLLSTGEPGVAGTVVALDVSAFARADARGEFRIELPDDATGLLWVRVPDGYRPGPVWRPLPPPDDDDPVDVPLTRWTAPAGALSFVVMADSHISYRMPFWADLGRVVHDAVSADPTPAFVTILGDITQGNKDEQFDLVDDALAGLAVPYIPVPGNHDWYDDGETWRRRYGPDNYSFDIGDVHVVVWNMAMSEDDITRYLGAELALVAPEMTIVALTHAPPAPAVVQALDALGVDYLLTGHTHTNRVVDHGRVVELATEPVLMGGLDYTPAGYRVVSITEGQLHAMHRVVATEPWLSIVEPRSASCTEPGDRVLVATDAAPSEALTARFDCGAPIALTYGGGSSWHALVPPLPAGHHAVVVTSWPRGTTTAQTFEVCTRDTATTGRRPWPQLGGSATRAGVIADEIAPPLAARWTTQLGGHAATAAPVIAGGLAIVAVMDLEDGDAGGLVAIGLDTGDIRWRVVTERPIHAGPVVAGTYVVVPQIDGTVLALDLASGAERWRHQPTDVIDRRGAAVFAGGLVDAGDVIVGGQRHLAALDATTGAIGWSIDPSGITEDFVTMAPLAADDGVVVGVVNLGLGGVIGLERATGRVLWRLDDLRWFGIQAAPVIRDGVVYVVTGALEAAALDLHTGEERWATFLDHAGFDWAIAAAGTPAIAGDMLVVPTMWGALFGLDTVTGDIRWSSAAAVGPLRTTHYRGRGEAGFAGAPLITGDIVWAADTSGQLVARDLATGEALWTHGLGAPVLAGLATTGTELVVTTFDGTVRLLGATAERRAQRGIAMRCPGTVSPGGRAWTALLYVAIGALGAAATAAWLAIRRRRRSRFTA